MAIRYRLGDAAVYITMSAFAPAPFISPSLQLRTNSRQFSSGSWSVGSVKWDWRSSRLTGARMSLSTFRDPIGS